MAVANAPISQEGSNFRKKAAKNIILHPKFQKVRFEMQKSSQFFRIFTVMVITATTAGSVK